jgi:hypothetical protein
MSLPHPAESARRRLLRGRGRGSTPPLRYGVLRDFPLTLAKHARRTPDRPPSHTCTCGAPQCGAGERRLGLTIGREYEPPQRQRRVWHEQRAGREIRPGTRAAARFIGEETATGASWWGEVREGSQDDSEAPSEGHSPPAAPRTESALWILPGQGRRLLFAVLPGLWKAASLCGASRSWGWAHAAAKRRKCCPGSPDC